MQGGSEEMTCRVGGRDDGYHVVRSVHNTETGTHGEREARGLDHAQRLALWFEELVSEATEYTTLTPLPARWLEGWKTVRILAGGNWQAPGGGVGSASIGAGGRRRVVGDGMERRQGPGSGECCVA